MTFVKVNLGDVEISPISQSLLVGSTMTCDKNDDDDSGDGDGDDNDLYIIGAVCLSVCVSAKVIIFVFKGFGRFSCL